MSLNRYEQALFDYLGRHPDEQRHWQAKVAGGAGPAAVQAVRLTEELWEFCRERSAHAEPFREWAARGGVPRSSLRNLADFLVRLWGPPPAPGRPSPSP